MKFARVSWSVALALTTAFVGCGDPASTQSTTSAPASTKPDDAKKVDEKTVDSKDVKLTDAELAGIKKLPEADQKLALEQKICPITNEHLGSMEEPVKVVLNDKTVFLCCDGCVKKAKADPTATLAKLGKK